MICPMVPFPVTLSDLNVDFKGTDMRAQLMRDLFAIAEFLFTTALGKVFVLGRRVTMLHVC